MVFWQILILSFAIAGFAGFLAIKHRHKHLNRNDFEVWREQILARDPEIETRMAKKWHEQHPTGAPMIGDWLDEKYLKRFDDGHITSVILFIISFMLGALATIF